MPLHPQVEKFLESARLSNAVPWHLQDIIELQASFEANALQNTPRTNMQIKKEDLSIPGPSGDLPIRIYYPEACVKTPSPVLVFYHGGGFSIGSVRTHDTICHEVCGLTGMLIVSVDYRKAPQHKFPQPLEDAYTGFLWAYHNCSHFGGDPSRIALFGDSAGGNLCCGVSMLSKARGGPPVSCQALLYPMCDYYLPGAPSYMENATGYSMERNTLIWFFGHYLNSTENLENPYLFPLRAKDFSVFPPTFLLTAQYDPLRDEGELFAQKLMQTGVDTSFVRYDGMIHGFSLRWATFDRGYDSLIELSEYLKRRLA